MKESVKTILASVISSIIVGMMVSFGVIGARLKNIEVDVAKNQEKIISSEKNINNLKINMGSLSDTYVTRREFNIIVENQNVILKMLEKKLDVIDSKIEKTQESIISSKNKNFLTTL